MKKDNTVINQWGFTLVEIMIVVTIIVLLAALAIPNILRQRLTANEASAVNSMRMIITSSHSYRAVNPSYPANISVLSSPNPPYIDIALGSGEKQGYEV